MSPPSSSRPLWAALFSVLLLSIVVAPAHAQDTRAPTALTLSGRVVDADTQAPLPQANLRIADTYEGTITNADGRYTLTLDSLPVTVVVRYVGYESVRRRITADTESRQVFRLAPSTVQMDEVTVTGSGNPGETIMRRVIERKQEWWPELKSYSVQAYNRFALASDTTIAAIAESQTTAFWDAERGTREVVRSQRGTANLQNLADGALPAAATVRNLYRDNVEVFGNRMIGVTHPDALDDYDFTLDTTRAIDGRRAFLIRVEPDNRLSSTFRGTVTVLDSTYALLEARLRPTTSLSTSRVLKEVNITFEQQFSNFGGPYWLPVDFRARRDLDVQFSALFSLSDIRIRQVSRLSDYQINVPLPDSLYDADGETDEIAMRADSTVGIQSLSNAQPDSLGGGPFVPYSQDEQTAYEQIDSTDTVQDAFDPGGLYGWLQDLGLVEEDGLSLGGSDADETAASDTTDAAGEDSGSSSFVDFEGGFPILRYNRVEGGHFGLRLNFGVGPLAVTGQGGYNTGPSGSTQWSYGGEATLPLADDTDLSARYHYGVAPRYRARARMGSVWARLSNSLWTLAGAPDYFDYFGNERLRVSIRQTISDPALDLTLQVRNERHFSVRKATDYNAFGRSVTQPANPSVDDGWLRSGALTATLGDGGLLGVFPITRVEVTVEHSDPDVAASDFDFTRVEAVADARFETFFQRRVRPNTLDLRVDAGASFGDPPLQRFGVVEASPQPYTPFGALRTLDDRPYQGEHHAALFWEHNVRTVPFELLGWQAPVEQDIELIVHGGHGRAWIDDDTEQRLRRRGVAVRQADGSHHEIGLSVNGLLYDSLRLDLTKRLDAEGLSLGVSVLRFL
ncbi:DUF5686 and carboxypeptidase-like regulatory domain-containing protein [Salinibacter altiplanensis]|uniref:DUF5686 and carboxypeptidase-like regulatory domain-containing protein n=2 Tax=Salinibacter altiplanensis TaxID=1803181 RepID=UPI000C9FE5E9|nr:DUF5686 and carboxypeptidase-like regulatory domain-containing protein [Salinibacter altiplanensis]